MESCYLAAPFNLVTEIIQHPLDRVWIQNAAQMLLLFVLLPQAWKQALLSFLHPGWCKDESKEHFCMCVVASAGCSALSRWTPAQGMCNCAHLGVPPLLVFLLLSPLSVKQRA